jgi:hypothetical protein
MLLIINILVLIVADVYVYIALRPQKSAKPEADPSLGILHQQTMLILHQRYPASTNHIYLASTNHAYLASTLSYINKPYLSCINVILHQQTIFILH